MSAAPAPPQPQPEPEHPSDRFHLRLGIAALGELGLVPDAGLGLALEPQLIVPGDWVISLRGSGVLESTEPIEGGGEVAIGALLGAIGICTPAASFWGLRGCAGARIGSLSIDASGLDTTRDTDRLLFGPWLDGELSWPIGAGVRLRAQAGVHVPLIRDTVQVLDENGAPVRAFRVAPLSFGMGVGLVVAIAE